MAQAARLNLRMQKELKLLLTDPPPGASFPHLSPASDSSSFSLAAIDAQIEGPEGTVYEKGIFKIKIQIPERYPFQPPVVTFNTPIYHPNIDTGGRICLDILNLPPKGAWQPSLNISTILTSIGLLLSEPNPDDGLMCEASKEYKYNKQVFDQKARSMTEKYARSDASPNHGVVQCLTDSSVLQAEDKAPELKKPDMNEHAACFKKVSGTSRRKLLLDASGSNTGDSNIGMSEIQLKPLSSQPRIQEPKQDSADMPFDHSKNHVQFPNQPLDHHDQDNKPTAISSKKLCLLGKNLQHKVLNSTTRVSDTMPLGLESQKGNVLYLPNDPKAQKIDHDQSSFTNPKRKKLGLTGKKPSLGFLSLPQNSENKIKVPQADQCYKGKPGAKMPRKPLQVLEQKDKHNTNLNVDTEVMNSSAIKHQVERLDEGVLEQGEGLCVSEEVIVLDSEDSEEETTGSLCSRRLIARKRLLGKH